MSAHHPDWLALCAEHGVDPDSIPDAPQRLPRLRNFVASRLTSRQRPRSPDRRASRDRRRMLGGSSVLPDNLRHHYTEGQRAVLFVVAGEIKHRGRCDLPNDKIAALAGVCRTTVQTTLHEARRLLHVKITERPRPGRKSLTNVVEIISREWLTWIKRGALAHTLIGSNSSYGVKTVSATKIRYLGKKVVADKSSAIGGVGPPLETQLKRRA